MTLMMYLGMWLEITIFFGCIQLVLFIFTTFPIALAHHRAWKRVVQEDLRVTPMTAFQRYRFFMIWYFRWGSFAMMIPLIIWFILPFVTTPITFQVMTTPFSYSTKINDLFFFNFIGMLWYGIFNLITTTFFLLFPNRKGGLAKSLILSFVFQVACWAGLSAILLLGLIGTAHMPISGRYKLSIILTTLVFIPTLFMFCMGVMRFDSTLSHLGKMLVKSD